MIQARRKKGGRGQAVCDTPNSRRTGSPRRSLPFRGASRRGTCSWETVESIENNFSHLSFRIRFSGEESAFFRGRFQPTKRRPSKIGRATVKCRNERGSSGHPSSPTTYSSLIFRNILPFFLLYIPAPQHRLKRLPLPQMHREFRETSVRGFCLSSTGYSSSRPA
jgi:hypothetical protein